MLHGSVKAATPPTDCSLERWRDEGREKGARAREDLRNGVEQALKLLGQGFLAHPANAKLRDELAKGTLLPQSTSMPFSASSIA